MNIEWRKINSNRWDFGNEFSIVLFRWGRGMWDVELWKNKVCRILTTAFTKDNAEKVAEKYCDELDTRDLLLAQWADSTKKLRTRPR